MLGGTDREDRSGKSNAEHSDDPRPLRLVESGGRSHIEAQLHSGIRGVHALTTGAGGAGELLYEFVRRHPEPLRRSWAWGYEQVIHLISVPHAGQWCASGVPVNLRDQNRTACVAADDKIES